MDLQDIREEIRILRDKSQTTENNLSASKASWDANNKHILSKIEALEERLSDMAEKIDNLNTIATQGSASLKTLFIVGSVFTTIIGIIGTLTGMIKF